MISSRACAIRAGPGHDFATGVHGPGVPNMMCQPIPEPVGLSHWRRLMFGCSVHSQSSSFTIAAAWTGFHRSVALGDDSVSMLTA